MIGTKTILNEIKCTNNTVKAVVIVTRTTYLSLL